MHIAVYDTGVTLIIKNIWKIVTILVATYLMLSIAPELRVFGLLIDVIGLDVFLLLLEVQVIVIFSTIYQHKIRPIFQCCNALFERADPLYFIPSREQIITFPPIIFHAMPFLVGVSFMLFANVSLYS